MNVSELDLNHVRALHHLLDEGHVARAAKRLGITPAAASNALRRLRVELGDELLARNGRGLVRTALGERLLEPAREALRAAAKIVELAEPFQPSTFRGDVEIATSDRLASLLLAPLDALFQKRAPDACLRIRVVPPDPSSWARSVPGVLVGALEPRGLSTERLFDERYVCVLRRGNPLLKGSLTVRRFAEAEHLLVAPKGTSDAGVVDGALAERGLARRVTRTVPSFSLVPALIRGSDRIATLPETFARTLDPAEFARCRPPIAVPVVTVRSAWHPANDGDARHAWIRRMIRDAVRAARSSATREETSRSGHASL